MPFSIKALKKNHKVPKMIKCDATRASLGAVIVSLVLLCAQFFTCPLLYCAALLLGLDPFRGNFLALFPAGGNIYGALKRIHLNSSSRVSVSILGQSFFSCVVPNPHVSFSTGQIWF